MQGQYRLNEDSTVYELVGFANHRTDEGGVLGPLAILIDASNGLVALPINQFSDGRFTLLPPARSRVRDGLVRVPVPAPLLTPTPAARMGRVRSRHVNELIVRLVRDSDNGMVMGDLTRELAMFGYRNMDHANLSPRLNQLRKKRLLLKSEGKRLPAQVGPHRTACREQPIWFAPEMQRVATESDVERG
jgi:hypothetical protein